MHVIALKKLREAWALDPALETPLRAWYKTAEKAKWDRFGDVRAFAQHGRPGRRVHRVRYPGQSIPLDLCHSLQPRQGFCPPRSDPRGIRPWAVEERLIGKG